MRLKASLGVTVAAAAILAAGLAATIAVAANELDSAATKSVPTPASAVSVLPDAPSPDPTKPSGADKLALLETYCSSCHNDLDLKGGMSMDDLQASDLTTGAHNDLWEKILHKLTLGEMPPKGKERPDKVELAQFTSWVTTGLDARGKANPEPGRAVLQRLNRVQYANAVRQLLNLDVDVSSQLPADDTGFGFDNIAGVLSVSPTLMDRYMVVASRVASQATGVASKKPAEFDYKVPKDANAQNRGIPAVNERSADDLPVDSRGGGAFKFTAPYEGDYTIRLTLNSNALEDTEVEQANVVEFRTHLNAGVRTIGTSFPRTLALQETAQTVYSNSDGSDPIIPKYGIVVPKEKPTTQRLRVQVDGVRVKTLEVPSYNNGPGFYQASFPRDVLRVSVQGPYDAAGPGDTPSRRKIFVCRPSASLTEEACARKIFSSLATQAYRRPTTVGEVDRLMKVYAAARKDTDFEHGIEGGIEAVLVSPNFLFMREPSPPSLPKGSIYQISDTEMATRLSLFLWSSIPDAELRDLAQKGKLKDPAVLRQQVARMIRDPRSKALTSNFAGQWLFLRNLDNQRPDAAVFPNFDMRLRASMLAETDMYFDYIVRQNRPVLEFIRSDYTFLNQRLAEHYGIPNVEGPALRKVTLSPDSHRGGLLGQGSILTVTSYDNRTSIVKRGKWILDNLLAAPPPPPPPDVPALNDASGGKKLSVRAQMETHRANPACAVCHNKMDPLGLALENYNADGSWREKDAGEKIDASTVLPDGTPFTGPKGLQDILLARKDSFTEAFTERLMIYALGRGLEPSDMPTVREIRRKAAADGYRVDTIILGVIESLPFQKRKVPTT